MMKSHAEIKSDLKVLISEDLAPVNFDDLTDDTDLTDGILDSYAIVAVFQFIENETGRPLEDSEMNRELVRTVEAITRFIIRERKV